MHAEQIPMTQSGSASSFSAGGRRGLLRLKQDEPLASQILRQGFASAAFFVDEQQFGGDGVEFTSRRPLKTIS